MTDLAHEGARSNAQWGTDDSGEEVLNIGGPAPAHPLATAHQTAPDAAGAGHSENAAKVMAHYADAPEHQSHAGSRTAHRSRDHHHHHHHHASHGHHIAHQPKLKP